MEKGSKNLVKIAPYKKASSSPNWKGDKAPEQVTKKGSGTIFCFVVQYIFVDTPNHTYLQQGTMGTHAAHSCKRISIGTTNTILYL